jgi:arylsulfatase A-like enzyme
MPTILDLAGLAVPESCDGLSAVGEARRELLYGEVLENHGATRMLHDGRHKLIWYPAGNHRQLFDLVEDPGELTDLSGSEPHAAVLDRLSAALAGHCHGKDVDEGWVRGGRLVGYDPGPYVPKPDRTFTAQRGIHYPQPPSGAVGDSIGFPE